MKDSKLSGGHTLLAPFKGLAAAYALTALIFVVYALLLTYTQLDEDSTGTVVLAALVVSLITGGFVSAAAAKRNGLVQGIVTGTLYVAVMAAVGAFAIRGYSLGSKTLVCLLLGIASGGLGGVLGINIFGGR